MGVDYKFCHRHLQFVHREKWAKWDEKGKRVETGCVFLNE